jgi:formylglycine-generating enzyme required for sulfatase activity
MADLSDSLFGDLLNFLTPHAHDEDFRKAWLDRPLRALPCYDDIVWAGSARMFTTHLIETLPHTALSAAVRELGELKGESMRIDAETLCARITAEGPAPAAYADPAQAYCARILNDPRLTRYKLAERFVKMRVLLDRGEDEASGRWADGGIEAADLPELLAKLAEQGPASAVTVLGAPGAGKSVLLRHLQTHAAQAVLDGRAGAQIPFFVSLNAYELDALKPLDWLRARWTDDAHELRAFDTLRRQGKILLLCDALNEMPHSGDLEARIERWRALLPDFVKDGNRAVFTCRAIDIGAGLSARDFPVPQATVQALEPAQIHAFLKRYTPDFADAIFAEIEADARLLDLYGTPFFLDLLVKQIRPDGALPESKAELFAGFVGSALRREIAARHPLFVEVGENALVHKRDREWLARRPRNAKPHELPTHGPLIGRLSALAFGMQKTDARSTTQVRASEHRALALLDHPRARDMLDAALRLNLIDEVHRAGGVDIQFYHQLFQEFFAARLFAEAPEPALVYSEWRAEAISPGIAELLPTLGKGERLPELPTTGWEETAQVAAAMAAKPEVFVNGLEDANLALTGRCASAPGVRVSADFKHRLGHALIARTQDMRADLRARIAAGLALGLLGDPRFERREGLHGAYLMPPLASIPGGVYTIGDGHYNDNAPCEVELAAFQIGQFPVTNAEYACFLNAKGYDEPRWWADNEAGARWQRGEGVSEGQKELLRRVRKMLQDQLSDEQIRNTANLTPEQIEAYLWQRNCADDEFETQLSEWCPDTQRRPSEPDFWRDSAFNNPAQPVLGICWHEARAYCAWLSAQTGQPFRLPTEAEWEAAARGVSGRVYAFGAEFDTASANTFEGHQWRTTPVGAYAATPAADDAAQTLFDMAGNVYEWTSSAYLPYPYVATPERESPEQEAETRVVRGGSWNYSSNYARAAYRNFFHPNNRYYFYGGFRLVCEVAPVSSQLGAL